MEFNNLDEAVQELNKLKHTLETVGKELRQQRILTEEWKETARNHLKLVNAQVQTIDDQAAEIRKLQEDYKKEMESMDKLITESDAQMKSLYIMLDNYKNQLQVEQMSNIDRDREIEYLRQFQPQPKLQ